MVLSVKFDCAIFNLVNDCELSWMICEWLRYAPTDVKPYGGGGGGGGLPPGI